MNAAKQFADAHAELQKGNVQKAVELCDKSLARFPGDANFLCLSARSNLMMKNFRLAAQRVEEAIRLYPEFALAHETRGDLLTVQGQVPAALESYQQAIRLDPTRAVIHDKLDRLKSLPTPDGPGKQQPAGRNNVPYAAEIELALEHERSGNHEAAEKIYRDILQKDPDQAEAARLLAGIASRNKRYREAEVFLQKAVSVAPRHLRAWVDLANAQREQDKFQEAIASAGTVVELAPESADSYMVLAGAQGASGDHSKAIESYRRALEIAPDRAAVYCGMAHHQKTIGMQDAAIASYRQAINIKPDHAEAYWSLANLKTFRFEDTEVAAMESLLNSGDLADEFRCQVHNALGLEYEARKNFDQAFENFTGCNRIRRKAENYDPVETEGMHDRLVTLFDAPFLERNAGADAAPVTPIFVVGLPRSGSTLIEQILASHSLVEGTHELGELSRAVQKARKSSRKKQRFPEALQDIDVAAWQDIGAEYLRRTEVYRSGLPYFIDKNPNNFIFAGVLKLALPNCRIIDARRHPLDSCFGSYKQLFASGQPFSYDMTELGEYYLQYDRLMKHWQQVLPGFVLDVPYEAVVADLEFQVRRMLDFCGLPFEDACLRFFETERAVKTASSEQVRRPIYASSVNLWRNYEPHLDELVHILEPVLTRLPPADRPGISGETGP